MEGSARSQVLKMGIGLALVYWLLATLRSTLLVDGASFFGQFFGAAGSDLILRIITVIAIIAGSWYAQKNIGLLSTQTEDLGTQIAKQQEALDKAGCMTLAVDTKQRVIQGNQAFTDCVGIKPDDLNLKEVTKVFHDEDANAVQTMVAETLAGKPQQDLKLLLKTRGQGKRNVVVSTALQAGEQEDDNKVLVFLEDVTELTSKANTNAAVNEAVHSFVESASQPIFMTNPQGSLAIWNQAMTDLTGLTRDQLDGAEATLSEVTGLIGQDMGSAVASAVESVAADKQQKVLELNLASGPRTGAQMLLTLLPFAHPEQGDMVVGSLVDLEFIAQRERALQDQVATLEGQVAELQTDIEQRTQVETENQERILELESQLEEEQNEGTNLKDQIDLLNDELDSVRGQLQNSTDESSELQTKNEELEQSVSDLQQEVDTLSHERATLEESFAQEKSALEDAWNQERAQLEQSLEEQRTSLEQSSGEQRSALEAQFSEERASLEQQLQETKDQAAQLKESGENTLAELMQTTESANDLRNTLSQLEADHEGLNAKWAELKTMIDQVPVPIMELDASGTISSLNQAAVHQLGLECDQSLEAFLSSEAARSRFAEVFEQLQGEEAASTAELEFTADEQPAHMLVDGIRFDAGDTQRSILIGQDITRFVRENQNLTSQLEDASFSRDNALAEIEIERDRLNAILEIIDEGILVTDVYNRVVLLNRKAEDMLETRLSAVIDRPANFLVRDRTFTDQLKHTLEAHLNEHTYSIQTSSPNSEEVVRLAAKSGVMHNKDNREVGVITRLWNQ